MTGRADRARAVLDSEEFKQAFQDVRDSLTRQFFETEDSDIETLVRINQYWQQLDAVKANLEQAIEDGELEDFRANQPEEG